MIEYVIWAINPLTGDRKPISDRVYDKKSVRPPLSKSLTLNSK